MNKFWQHTIHETFIITGLARTTIIPVVFKHYTLTLCTLVTTQYEKSWKNTRIHIQVYTHLHTKLYTGRFGRKGRYFRG